jgi:hypothetical protein
LVVFEVKRLELSAYEATQHFIVRESLSNNVRGKEVPVGEQRNRPYRNGLTGMTVSVFY